MVIKMGIKEWLDSLGLEQYADVFIENDIEESTLFLLTSDELKKELGVKSLGHRKKILKAIEDLKTLKSPEEKVEKPIYSDINTRLNISKFPSILAISLNEYFEESNPVIKLWHACDTIELMLRLSVIIGLSDIKHQKGEVSEEIICVLQSRIEYPTLGKWQEMGIAIAKGIDKEKSLIPEIVDFVCRKLNSFLYCMSGKNTVGTAFIALRNQLAHGGGVTRGVGNRLLSIWSTKFEDLVSEATWMKDLSFVTHLVEGEYCLLQGLGSSPKKNLIKSSLIEKALNKIFVLGSEVALVRDNTVLPLWPLIVYGIPQVPDPDVLPAKVRVPQVYVRKGDICLQFTPIGSEEVCQSEEGGSAINAFLKFFRFSELEAGKKKFEVRDFEKDIHKDSELLIGRSEELEVVRNALHETKEGVLWLTGPAGIGKSFLVARIAEEYIDAPPTRTFVLPYRFKAGDDRCSRDRFLRFAIERLQTREELKLPEEGNNEKKKPIDELTDLLKRLNGSKVLFILDGLDEIAEKDSNFANDIPFKINMPGVVWFCAGRSERRLPETFLPERCMHLFPEGLPPMTTGDIRTMILEKIGPLRKRLLKNDQEKDGNIINPFINQVSKNADGLPIYIKYVIGDILSNKYIVLDGREQLPPSLESYHEKLLKRCGMGTLSMILTPLVATLAVAREPLTQNALAEILIHWNVLALEDSPISMIEKALATIGSIIKRITTDHGGDGFTLYHHSMRQHILKSDGMKSAVSTSLKNLSNMLKNWNLIKNFSLKNYIVIYGPEHTLSYIEKTVESSKKISILNEMEETVNEHNYLLYRIYIEKKIDRKFEERPYDHSFVFLLDINIRKRETIFEKRFNWWRNFYNRNLLFPPDGIIISHILIHPTDDLLDELSKDNEMHTFFWNIIAFIFFPRFTEYDEYANDMHYLSNICSRYISLCGKNGQYEYLERMNTYMLRPSYEFNKAMSMPGGMLGYSYDREALLNQEQINGTIEKSIKVAKVIKNKNAKIDVRPTKTWS